MSHQYHRGFDHDGQNSLSKLARLIRPGSCVLDVRAGPGVLACYLSEHRSCYVDGIEYDRLPAEQGARCFRSLWVADLNVDCPSLLVGDERYDYIVCADILEHLSEPAKLLRRLVALLEPHGRLLLSIPNVAHAGLIAELIGGELRYRDEGLLDRTHIQFFTRASLMRMLEECGLRARSIDTVTVPIKDTEFAPDALDILAPSVREQLFAGEDALTYQFIVECIPRGAAALAVPLPQAYEVRSLVPVDVVVAVYAGLSETRACIESVLAAPVRASFELVVIDDCGPDLELRAWLGALAADGRITVIANSQNLGYVASINRGIEVHPDRDVILLNSDTEVANDWLDRLRAAAYASPNIGTVTPFANSGATICSYPLFCRENPVPEGWSVESLDALVRDSNFGAGVDLATAVGFCTYIRRDCLNAVGCVDAEAFGRVYGEDNDFSMRAHYQGWRHRLAGDLFLWHQGGVSFGSRKAALVEAAQLVVRERHPFYDSMLSQHIRDDPARPLRQHVDWQRLARSPQPRLLFISHALGGASNGTAKIWPGGLNLGQKSWCCGLTATTGFPCPGSARLSRCRPFSKGNGISLGCWGCWSA